MSDAPPPDPAFAAQDAASERFAAFCGLHQWADACIEQAERITAARDAQKRDAQTGFQHMPELLLTSTARVHAACHFFAVAAGQVFAHRDWTLKLALVDESLFAHLDRFDRQAITDVRNMREHGVEYLAGKGQNRTRWVYRTTGFSADASTLVGVMIGGRLDYMAFAVMAEHLRDALRAMPIPFPPESPSVKG